MSKGSSREAVLERVKKRTRIDIFFFQARQGCPLSKCICTANAIFLMILKKHKVRVGKEKYEICPLATCDFYEILKYVFSFGHAISFFLSSPTFIC